MEASFPSSGLRALQEHGTYIIKIGGENAADLKANAERVRARTAEGKKQILTVSALRSSDPAFNRFADPSVVDRDSDKNPKNGFNTTSHLIALAERLVAGDTEGAHDLFERVRSTTKEIVRTEINRDPQADTAALCQTLFATIDDVLDRIHERIFSAKQPPFAVKKDWLLPTADGTLSITGIGETLAKAIYLAYFREQNIAAAELPTEGSLQLIHGKHPEELLDRHQICETIDCMRNSARSHISALLRMHDVAVTGGYLPVLGSQRGYSDKTGALFAQAAQEAGHHVLYAVEKPTSIMSADPRKKIAGARVVPDMTYELAMEAFGDQRGADGGAIHAGAVRMLAEYDIPAVVFNPDNMTEGNVTHIHAFDPQPNGVDIVASRRMPIALEIQSIQMLGHAGFVYAATQWFATQDPPIPIDQISTSEVTVSFTFANGDFPESKVTEFEAFLQQTFGPSPDLQLTVTRGKSLLFCMGNNMRCPGVARDATAALADVGADIHFIAQGLNERVMTFMVDSEKAPDALRRLHEKCIGRK